MCAQISLYLFARDWAVAFDHNNTQSTFSANVFNNHDLTPPLSVFGSRPNNKRKDDDIMSPLLDLNEQDACFDETSQSLLNSHKQTLFNRWELIYVCALYCV